MKYFIIWFLIVLSFASTHYNLRPPPEEIIPIETPPPPIVYGSIEGPLELNPGSLILGGTKVCAENIVSKEKICTDGTTVNYINNGPGYSIIDVPPGEYHVFAQYELKKVYYSHTVSVGSGERVDGIMINPENLYH